MKIPLGDRDDVKSGKVADNRRIEACILGCKRGDWEARKALVSIFAPLLRTLADKRADGDRAERERLLARGREGLMQATRKFNIKQGASHFRIFAVSYIEKRMDASERGGWFKRWFGRG